MQHNTDKEKATVRQKAPDNPTMSDEPTPEAIAADKASLMLYKATHAAALPEEPQTDEPQTGHKAEPLTNEQVKSLEERGKAYRLYRVAQEIANCGCDLGDSERRIRLYYALEQINPNWDKDKGGTFAFDIGESSEVQS